MTNNSFLDLCLNKNRINETDKKEILLLYANLQTYNFSDVFSSNVIYKFHKSSMDWSNRIITDKSLLPYMIRGVAISKNNNRIFKLWIINKEHPHTNDICFQMLIEYYFHTIFLTSTTDNILVVPQIYNYGKVIIETNNEVLYFYEMEYYDSTKYVLDSINNLDVENKLHKIRYLNDIFNNGYAALCNMESRTSVFHIDHDTPVWFNGLVDNALNASDKSSKDRAVEYLIQNIDTLTSYNNLIYNDKFVLIDFGEAGRNNYDKQSNQVLETSLYYTI